MSKCDLQIVFDRPDRTFRGGDEVTGTVHVRVNQEVRCNGLVVEHFWQTHGRGNTATGPKQKQVLFQGNLRAGETLSYRFTFPVPNGPPTYHGTYLNVDHYVAAHVDIPWAFDPKCREEYVLLPCGRDWGYRPALTNASQNFKKFFSMAGVPVGVLLIVLGLIFPCPFALFLIPAGCIAIFFSLRKILAEKKIGTVKLSWGALTASPGESFPLEIRFTPRHSSALNGITAKLVGVERCVSGSGTNKHTHTHKLYERTVPLVQACQVTAGRPVRVQGNVPIPQTDAFSFSAHDNDLIWSLEVRVDIPMWPDWIEKRVLTVRPPAEAEFVEPIDVEPIAVEPIAADPGAAEAQLQDEFPFAVAVVPVAEPAAEQPAPAEPLVPDRPPEGDRPAGQEAPATGASGTDPGLLEIAGRLAGADRYSSQQKDIIGETGEHRFACAVEITKIDRTYSYTPDERFRKGRTVTGVIAGSDHKVSVQLSDSWNERLESLGPGNAIQADCVLVKWNGIYDRLEMREA